MDNAKPMQRLKIHKGGRMAEHGVAFYRTKQGLADEGIHAPILAETKPSTEALEATIARLKKLGFTEVEAKKLL
ncbi:MAG: hypothetical protein PHD65_01110 [Gallionella sp.]|nr:hypothetical protein [Gallionella sp.]